MMAMIFLTLYGFTTIAASFIKALYSFGPKALNQNKGGICHFGFRQGASETGVAS